MAVRTAAMSVHETLSHSNLRVLESMKVSTVACTVVLICDSMFYSIRLV